MRQPMLEFRFPWQPEAPAVVQTAALSLTESQLVRCLIWVLYLLISSLPPEQRRRFVHHLLLAFHPDRCPLAEAHAVAVVLTQLMNDLD